GISRYVVNSGAHSWCSPGAALFSVHVRLLALHHFNTGQRGLTSGIAAVHFASMTQRGSSRIAAFTSLTKNSASTKTDLGFVFRRADRPQNRSPTSSSMRLLVSP
ncbi:unnamed protein product, partial [Scytosiphon promiscuus]